MLNAVDVTPINTWVAAYTCAAATRAAVTLNLTNRSAGAAAVVRVAIGPSASGSITNAHYLEYDQPIPANDVLERSGLVLKPGQALWVWTHQLMISSVVMGIEE